MSWANIAAYYQSGPSQNPPGPREGSYRVLRGGSWLNSLPFYFRCAFRLRDLPVDGDYTVGFRCVVRSDPA